MIAVFSDIHGCFYEFQLLLDYIKKKFGKFNIRYIFLGDYIDRGPGSKEVVDKVIEIEPKVCLLGNHEDMMIRYIKTGRSSWLSENNGGLYTLKSFSSIEKIKEYFFFFESLKFLHVETLYGKVRFLFSHANLPSNYPLDKAIRWKGDYSSFLKENEITLSESNIWYRIVEPIEGYVLVHGHTPTYDNKISFLKINGKIVDINIDTGCVYGGHLTTLFIPENEQELKETSYNLIAINEKFDKDKISIFELGGDL
ncbi:serine/threonine protein phosphatase 1 [Thermosipho japonicus]|uniref:Serine/threonine protein phosphatase 1 n=1 Tax=Thermosipho japonicus TaxID=90323 RepID=A0A841GEH4_9BACT|nr:metallophosphoesterase family protein [Thermosipho japonicus]MBB6062026.1 serine/threonine protein phosphatase 1 [Thermosipho japonicus]